MLVDRVDPPISFWFKVNAHGQTKMIAAVAISYYPSMPWLPVSEN
jgi:hypothetical protein